MLRMGDFSENEHAVGDYYDRAIFQAELDRLPIDSPVEFAMTLRCLERYVPAGCLVLEIGVGGAHYTEFLAARGCRLHLADISRRVLEHARQRLERGGLADRIAGIHHASGRALEGVASGALDAVLLMGPLYHLRSPQDRERAVAEAGRVLKSGGVLVASGINRMAYLRDQFREHPQDVLARREFHARYLRDGNLDPEHAPPIGCAHMTGAADFRALFGAFEPLAYLAVESFTGPWQAVWHGLHEAERAAWLDLVEATSAWPEAFGLADHYLFVGRKPDR